MAKEYIEREAAYDALTEYYHHSTDTQHGALREALSRVPAADVVEVVRCKNCLSWKKDSYGGVCDRYGVRLDGDWFCAGGEKREVQHDD